MMLDAQSVLVGACLPAGVWILLRALVSRPAHADSKPRAQPLKRNAAVCQVAITGSTKGLGLALAESFLELGDDVVVSSRDAARTSAAVAQLQERFPDRGVHGRACDVRDESAVEALADFAVQRMGSLDLWINNAGCSQAHKAPLVDTPADTIKEVLDTNVLGSMLGSRAAARVMAARGGGKIFLVDGAGATGGATANSAAYGASKRALTQLKASLAKEAKGTAVTVHLASPGMVATDLLAASVAHNPRVAWVLNILAEEPHTVARWLAPRMRGVKGNGTYFKYLTPLGALWRFATAWRRRGRFYPTKPESSGNTAGAQEPLLKQRGSDRQ